MVDEELFLKLKVYVNKRNQQGVVVIPKKLFNGSIPEFISVRRKKDGKK